MDIEHVKNIRLAIRKKAVSLEPETPEQKIQKAHAAAGSTFFSGNRPTMIRLHGRERVYFSPSRRRNRQSVHHGAVSDFYQAEHGLSTLGSGSVPGGHVYVDFPEGTHQAATPNRGGVSVHVYRNLLGRNLTERTVPPGPGQNVHTTELDIYHGARPFHTPTFHGHGDTEEESRQRALDRYVEYHSRRYRGNQT